MFEQTIYKAYTTVKLITIHGIRYLRGVPLQPTRLFCRMPDKKRLDCIRKRGQAKCVYWYRQLHPSLGVSFGRFSDIKPPNATEYNVQGKAKKKKMSAQAPYFPRPIWWGRVSLHPAFLVLFSGQSFGETVPLKDHGVISSILFWSALNYYWFNGYIFFNCVHYSKLEYAILFYSSIQSLLIFTEHIFSFFLSLVKFFWTYK